MKYFAKKFIIIAALKLKIMSFADLMYETGEAVQSTFGILTSLKNTPNVIFITIMSFLFLWWIWKMVQYDKEAEQSGGMK